jgi:hypothetical protein
VKRKAFLTMTELAQSWRMGGIFGLTKVTKSLGATTTFWEGSDKDRRVAQGLRSHRRTRNLPELLFRARALRAPPPRHRTSSGSWSRRAFLFLRVESLCSPAERMMATGTWSALSRCWCKTTKRTAMRVRDGHVEMMMTTTIDGDGLVLLSDDRWKGRIVGILRPNTCRRTPTSNPTSSLKLPSLAAPSSAVPMRTGRRLETSFRRLLMNG